MRGHNGKGWGIRWIGLAGVVFCLAAVSPCEQEDKTRGPTKIGIEGGVEKGPNGSEVIIPAGSVGTDYSEWQKCGPEECGVPIDIEITREPAPKDLKPPEGAEVFSDVYVVRASRHVFAPNPVSTYMFVIKIPLKDKVTSGEEVCVTDVTELYWCEDFEGEVLDPTGRFALARSAELYGPDSPAVIRLPGTPTEIRLIGFRKTPAKLPQVAPQRASAGGKYFKATYPAGLPVQQVQTALTALDASLETYRRLGFPEPKLDVVLGSQGYHMRILWDTSWPCTDSTLLGQYEPQRASEDASRSPSGRRPRITICQRSLSDPSKVLTTITGTIKSLDGSSAALIHNGEETLISVSSSGRFSHIIILRVGENIVRVRATNAVGTSLSDPLTINYSPTATAGKMALRTTLVWDTETDQDLHVWTPSGAQVYFATDQADGGELDVDNTRGFGPENVTFPVLKEGRYAIGVNYYSGSAATNVIVRVSVNEGMDFQQALSFGPQLLTKSNGDSDYPVTATTESWWRVADVVVSAKGVARIDPPTETPLKQATGRSRPRKMALASN